MARPASTRVLAGAFARWIPLAIAIVGAFAFVYLAVQQGWRMGADFPQVQLAEDAAARLGAGVAPPSAYDAPEKLDITSSLAPWLAIYDDAGRPVVSSGLLDGRAPQLPAGVLEHARNAGVSRVTWQPRPGVRDATVVRRFDGAARGFVVAGRSLREAERHIADLRSLAVLAMLLTLAASLAAQLALAFLTPAR